MSYIYSRALVGEFLADNCSDIDAFAQSNGSPTPNPSWWHDRTMAVSRHSRYGMTFSPLTESHGADVLMWWLEGFPVRTSALQERAQESADPEAECGNTWRGWLAKFDHDSSSWKTAQLSLLGDSARSLATFPRSGMTRGGLLWELPTLERLTSETGSGFWQTPVADDAANRAKGKWNSRGEPKLSAQVLQWPTPTVCGNYNRKGASKTSGDGLATAVALSLTTICSASTDAQTAKAQTFPTPMSRDWKDTGPTHGNRKSPGLGCVVGGRLNPDWVEWLMGWPIGWTGLKPSETAKSQLVQPQPGALLEVLE